MQNDQLFTARDLAILQAAQFDPQATRMYEVFSGGFYWSDERLHLATENYAFRYVIGYRASISEGASREGLRAAWDQLLGECPDWPGFRPERSARDLAIDLEKEWKKVEADLNAGMNAKT